MNFLDNFTKRLGKLYQIVANTYFKNHSSRKSLSLELGSISFEFCCQFFSFSLFKFMGRGRTRSLGEQCICLPFPVLLVLIQNSPHFQFWYGTLHHLCSYCQCLSGADQIRLRYAPYLTFEFWPRNAQDIIFWCLTPRHLCLATVWSRSHSATLCIYLHIMVPSGPDLHSGCIRTRRRLFILRLNAAYLLFLFWRGTLSTLLSGA